MFKKSLAGVYGAKRAIMEKAGKVEVHQEGAEFDAKIQSLFATHRAFMNLRKVGKSIFDSKGRAKKNDPDAVQNPADLFLTQINEGLKHKKAYDKARLSWETAKQRAFNAAEAAKTPGKNQDKKDKVAQDLKEDEEAKKLLYEAAKNTLTQEIENLEEARDGEFQKTVTAMCTILTDLQPDWNQIEATAGGNEVSPGDEQKDNGDAVDNSAPVVDAVDNSAPVGQADGGTPPPVRDATDSESD